MRMPFGGAGAPGVDLAVAAAPLQFPPPTAHERSSAEIQRRLVELTADEPAATAAADASVVGGAHPAERVADAHRPVELRTAETEGRWSAEGHASIIMPPFM